MYYAYVLESLKNQIRYIGSTDNLQRRFKEHNSDSYPHTFSYRNRPWKLIYYEAYINKLDAVTAEKFYKTGYGREVLKGKLENYLNPHKL